MANKPTIHELSEKIEQLSREDELADELKGMREELAERDKVSAINEAVKKRDWWWIKKLITLCVVMWSTLTYIGREVGGFLYDNYSPVRIGVDAAIAAWKARHG